VRSSARGGEGERGSHAPSNKERGKWRESLRVEVVRSQAGK